MLPYFTTVMPSEACFEQKLELQETPLDIHACLRFCSDHHSIRRSDRYWVDLSSDFITKQSLMCSLKINGGQTRGTGMGKKEHLVWFLGMCACAEVMQFLTDVAFTTSGKHKDTNKTCQNRDHGDTKNIFNYFQEGNPVSGSNKSSKW